MHGCQRSENSSYKIKISQITCTGSLLKTFEINYLVSYFYITSIILPIWFMFDLITVYIVNYENYPIKLHNTRLNYNFIQGL